MVPELASKAATQGAEVGRMCAYNWECGNQARNLLNAIGWPEGVPELDWIDLGGDKVHPYLDPIKVFETFIEKQPEKLNQMLRGPPGAIPEFLAEPSRQGCI